MKRGESNLFAHIVIASEAKQSPNQHGDCFVAALLAMTIAARRCDCERSVVEKRGESNLLCLIVIASEAKQSPNQHGDCFVAALLAMTIAARRCDCERSVVE